MLKLMCTSANGRQLLILGLSRINFEMLMSDRPIPIKVEDFMPNMAFDLLLIGGETEEAMVESLTKLGLDMTAVPAFDAPPPEKDHVDCPL